MLQIPFTSGQTGVWKNRSRSPGSLSPEKQLYATLSIGNTTIRDGRRNIGCQIVFLMPKSLHFYIVGLLLIASTAASAQQKNIITKQKKITRYYSVEPSDSLIVNDAFGDVHIDTWDRNEVAIEVVVTGRSYSEKRSQDIIDNAGFTDIVFRRGDGRLTLQPFLKTPYNNNNGVNGIIVPGATDHGMELNIDFFIHAPSGNPGVIKVNYGNAYINNYSGSLLLRVFCGNYFVKNLSGEYKTLMVDGHNHDNCANTIDGIDNAEVMISSGGKLVVKNARNLFIWGYDSLTIYGTQQPVGAQPYIITKNHHTNIVDGNVFILGPQRFNDTFTVTDPISRIQKSLVIDTLWFPVTANGKPVRYGYRSGANMTNNANIPVEEQILNNLKRIANADRYIDGTLIVDLRHVIVDEKGAIIYSDCEQLKHMDAEMVVRNLPMPSRNELFKNVRVKPTIRNGRKVIAHHRIFMNRYLVEVRNHVITYHRI